MKKLILKSTVGELEMCNFILDKAISQLSNDEEILKSFNMTKSDIKLLESLRHKITMLLLDF